MRTLVLEIVCITWTMSKDSNVRWSLLLPAGDDGPLPVDGGVISLLLVLTVSLGVMVSDLG